jgi:hypothetical protein
MRHIDMRAHAEPPSALRADTPTLVVGAGSGRNCGSLIALWDEPAVLAKEPGTSSCD